MINTQSSVLHLEPACLECFRDGCVIAVWHLCLQGIAGNPAIPLPPLHKADIIFCSCLAWKAEEFLW